MYYAIIGRDKPNSVSLRMAKRDAHRAYLHGDLSAYGVRIVYGGPLLELDQETPIGSLIVIEAPTIEAAHTVLANDPYQLADLFVQIEVLPWRFAIGQQ